MRDLAIKECIWRFREINDFQVKCFGSHRYEITPDFDKMSDAKILENLMGLAYDRMDFYVGQADPFEIVTKPEAVKG